MAAVEIGETQETAFYNQHGLLLLRSRSDSDISLTKHVSQIKLQKRRKGRGERMAEKGGGGEEPAMKRSRLEQVGLIL